MRRGTRSARTVERPDASVSHQGCPGGSRHRGRFSLRSRSRHHHVPSSVGIQESCLTIPAHQRPDQSQPLRSRHRSKCHPRLSDITAAGGASRRKTETRPITAPIGMCFQWQARRDSTPKPGVRSARFTRSDAFRRNGRRMTTRTSRLATTPKTPSQAPPTPRSGTAAGRRASAAWLRGSGLSSPV
jgi:hypothetical protein